MNLSKTTVHIFVISALVALIYSNTLNVPFQFDDADYIPGNPALTDISYVLSPESALTSLDLAPNVRASLKSRQAAYMSFYLNRKIVGNTVTGYHIINILIHILSSVIAYFLIRSLFKAPALKNTANAESAALLTALLFASHPLQTQAVTYISQRFTSLAGLFYLASALFYIIYRNASEDNHGTAKKILAYLLALSFAAAAMKTKENSFTLPAALTAIELVFYNAKSRQRILMLAPFFASALIVPLNLINWNKPFWDALSFASKTSIDISRADYLLTESRVVMTYLRLFFAPVNQNLDYDYPVYKTLLDFGVAGSIAFLSALLYFAVVLIRKPSRGLRLAGFGILWFFITLSVESSFIPIVDVIFEHRMYLPLLGLGLAVSVTTLTLSDKTKAGAKAGIIALLLAVAVFSAGSYVRNSIWKTEIALWEDVVKKSPQKPRPRFHLALAYKAKGMMNECIEQNREGVRLDPKDAKGWSNLANSLKEAGRIDEAIDDYIVSIKLNPKIYEPHYNLGLAFQTKGLYSDAVKEFESALGIRPNEARVHNSLGNALAALNRLDDAIEHYETAILINPNYALAHNNLKIANELKLKKRR